MRHFFFIAGIVAATFAAAQSGVVSGKVSSDGRALAYATVGIEKLGIGTLTNDSGYFELIGIPNGKFQLRVSMLGFQERVIPIQIVASQPLHLNIDLEETGILSDDVVISATLSPVSRDKSPVAIEVYRPSYFLKNPTPNLFEALQTVNGVRPQVNCSICNTGDIHLNGLEGPYTMVTIDGMPIVSGLGTVYGLSGIPNALVERIEIIKGPASTLYGSEAVGGLINVVTKSPNQAPRLSSDYFVSSWGEHNLDIGTVYGNKKVNHLLGVNTFHFSRPTDLNDDGFTDLALSNRVSIFHKSNWKTNAGYANIALRGVYEDRWGGQLNWSPEWKGSDSIYGETIQTKRAELLANIPFRVNNDSFTYQLSASIHNQDSWYGTTPYFGKQDIFFQQFTWNKSLGDRHRLLSGLATRITWYDDNTPATETATANQPDLALLPGAFVQHDWHIGSNQELLSGLRYDYHSIHGSILTPRVNYKIQSTRAGTFRLGAGNGYRVANVFTEDHAALTGARTVVFEEALKPEKSWNVNASWQKFVSLKKGFLQIEAGAFYTYFHNKIIPDYLSNPNEIRYQNLPGHAISQGIQGNVEWMTGKSFRAQSGFTWMHNYTVDIAENGDEIKSTQLLTERFSATWSLSYTIPKIHINVDYTGNVYSPMLLPLLGPLDPRPEYSPWYSIQNIQLSRDFIFGFTLYGGVKNLLDFTPPANSIARAFDPFDKQVVFNPDGSITPSADNPNALSFDPSYVFTSFQGRRYFIGLRWKWA
ncbi:MAG: TonB-dependent receptor plug domain-containing protein [Bacteroidota bacterium]|nr:TonB-dependent receptor plug domain-containing protein [Bacteroidota bacterium]